MWPSRMPSSLTGDGQEPLKLPSSSSGSSWPRSLLGDMVAVIELGIMAPWSSPFHFLTSQWRSPHISRTVQSRSLHILLSAEEKMRQPVVLPWVWRMVVPPWKWYCHECGVWLCHPGSGAAMSVAYGCATLEVVLPWVWRMVVPPWKWYCYECATVLSHSCFIYISSTKKRTPKRKWEIQISYLKGHHWGPTRHLTNTFFLVSLLPLHRYHAWGLEG